MGISTVLQPAQCIKGLLFKLRWYPPLLMNGTVFMFSIYQMKSFQRKLIQWNKVAKMYSRYGSALLKQWVWTCWLYMYAAYTSLNRMHFFLCLENETVNQTKWKALLDITQVFASLFISQLSNFFHYRCTIWIISLMQQAQVFAL